MSDEQYWDDISSEYEQLYSSIWCKYEDKVLAADLLTRASKLGGLKVLDIGCGTGLGYQILSGLEGMEYTGVDISNSMLSKLSERYPLVRTVHADANEIGSILSDEKFDLVMCLNVVGSFFADCTTVLRSSTSLMESNGILYFSFLNRHSLRRAIRFKVSRFENYQTRGAGRSLGFVKATTYTYKDLVNVCEQANLRIKDIGYRSVLGGVLETDYTVSADQFLRSIVGALGHELYVVCESRT